ncbi:hemolysin E [Microcoleus sp. Pol11C3]|uniref:hemolysin E n=1 Tax=Microcoleus sp. Pol11C3 TaxID=3055390 RepID=UPI002FD4FE03
MVAQSIPQVEIVQKGLEASDKALELYNKVIDQVIPWKTFEDTIKELTKFEKEYSEKAAILVGEIKTLLMNSNDDYLKAVQSVYEWCGLASQLLKAYLQLFDNYNTKTAEGQKVILLKVLEEGITKMTLAQDSLSKSSKSFNDASGKLATLNNQLGEDFNKGSSYYESQVDNLRKQAYGGAAAGAVLGPFGLIISYAIAAGVLEGKLIPELQHKLEEVKRSFERMKSLVETADKDITTTKGLLKDEIQKIGDIKVTTQTTMTYVDLDDVLINALKKSAWKLIQQCDEYMKRHQS